MWREVIRPTTVAEALDALAQYGSAARIVAGGTDVLVELQRGVKPTATLIDLSALRELTYVRQDGETIAIGGLATHNDLLAAPFARSGALPLAQACIEPARRSPGTSPPRRPPTTRSRRCSRSTPSSSWFRGRASERCGSRTSTPAFAARSCDPRS